MSIFFVKTPVENKNRAKKSIDTVDVCLLAHDSWGNIFVIFVHFGFIYGIIHQLGIGLEGGRLENERRVNITKVIARTRIIRHDKYSRERKGERKKKTFK